MALAIALVASFAGTSAAAATEPPIAELTTHEVDAWLDGLLPAALEREGIVGASIAVVAGGEIVTQRGFGSAVEARDGTDAVPVDAESTLFRIGSISKLVTATAVMQLVEAGVLDLDAPIADYLDEPIPVRFDEPITLRHLLTHSAGFEDKQAGLIVSAPEEPQSLRDAVYVDPPEQIFEPGTVPAYSNYSNGIAADIVERVSREPFEDYVQEHVFDAAGMTTATLRQPLDADQQEAMSAGYDAVGSAEVPFEVVTPAPAGAIAATATDMAHFLLAQLGHAGPGGPLLSEAALEEMHAPGLDAATLGGLAAGPRMTIGFFEDERNGHRVLSHGGDLTAFHAQLELYPDDDAGVYVSLNSTGVRGDSSTAIREAVAAGFADRFLGDGGSDTPATATAEQHAAAIAGSYEVSRRGESTFIRLFYLLSTIDVVADGDTVTVSAITDMAGNPVALREVEPWVWQEVDGDRRVAVDQADGAVRAIALNPAFTLQPLPTWATAVPLVAVGALAVLAALLLAWPIAAVARWVSGVRRHSDERDVLLRWWIRGSLVALVLSGILWVVVAGPLLGGGAAPSPLIVRAAQALIGLAVLGVVPAAWRLVRQLRGSAGEEPLRRRVVLGAIRTVTVLAFVGLGYVVIAGGLLQPSISY